uniref:Intermediate filament protein n=1 Tax=Glottidia pyramidata TaxID=34515 RepID=Q9GRW3_GLOPY|nr:intermediate filament protein [Glottidia pyramidata]
MSSSGVKITRKTESSSSSTGGGGGGMSGGMSGGSSSAQYSSSSSSSSMKPGRHSRYKGGYSSSMGMGMGMGGMGGGGSTSRTVTIAYGSSFGAGGGLKVSDSAAESLARTREREKHDMQDLNERLASYIEKVRFLEAQNRKLSAELDALKAKWGKETAAVKTMYEDELSGLRRDRDDLEKEKDMLETKVEGLEIQIDNLRRENEELIDRQNNYTDEINRLIEKVSALEGENNLLKRRIDFVEVEYEDAKKNADKWKKQCLQRQMELEAEIVRRMALECDVKSLQDEMDFMKGVHDQEMKELAALAYRDTTQENREYWTSEMSMALKEIQREFDDRLEANRCDMEQHYQLKIQESRNSNVKTGSEIVNLKEEIQRLRSQLTDKNQNNSELDAQLAALRAELNAKGRTLDEMIREWELERSRLIQDQNDLQTELEQCMANLQRVLDTKMSMELEIAAYRKLLESEESRIGLRSVVEQVISSGGESSMSMSGGSQMASQSVMKGEMSAKTTYQRSAKGPITVSQVDPNGHFVEVENTSRKNEDISSWKIKRKADDKEREGFTFPSNTQLGPGQKMTVYGRGRGPRVALRFIPSRLPLDCNLSPLIEDNSGANKASHVQKTSYT